MSIELQLALARAMQSGLGASMAPLDARANVRDFVEHYALAMDGQRYDLTGRYKHLAGLFEDTHPFIVTMAGAQTGKSAWLMAHIVRDFVTRWGGNFGYYFPDYLLPRNFSRERFAPFVRSNEVLAPWLGRTQKQGKGADAILTRNFGASTIFFLSTRGLTATEGMPLQGVYFDEVRRMEQSDVERAMERYSAQEAPIDIKVSTARYPESDIHRWFLQGDQRYFHTACACPDGVVLSLAFSDCIFDLRDATSDLLNTVRAVFERDGVSYLGMTDAQRDQFGEIACYGCPVCGEIITDPRDGWWEAHEPDNFIHSYQMSQLLSWTYPASRVLWKYENNQDVQEFWNSTIGLPFLDPLTQLVQEHHLAACVNTELRWAANRTAAWRRKHLRNTAMGVDVQAGYNVVVIKQLAPNGKWRTIHLEVAHEDGDDDQWKRTGRLMQKYDVRIAVIDAAPEFSAARRFAQAFKGRVYLATYVDSTDGDLVSWKDVGKQPSQKGDEIRFPFRCNIQRTRALNWSLGRWVKRVNEVPDPRRLIQKLPRQGDRIQLTAFLRIGKWVPVPIAELYFLHQQCVVFRKIFATEEAERQGRWRITAEHVRLDPHFAHANLYCDVAMARIGSPASPRRL